MRVLIAVDDDRPSQVAVARAMEWLPEDAEVVALHVAERTPTGDVAPAAGGGLVGYPFAPIPPRGAVEDDAALEPGIEAAKRTAAIAHGRSLVMEGDPVGTITRVADDIDADLIVVGTGDRSFWSRLVDPPVGTTIADHADRSVLLVRERRGGGAE